MGNTLKIYMDDVNSFNSFLELGNEENIVVEKNEGLQQIYTLKESQSLLFQLMNKLKIKHS